MFFFPTLFLFNSFLFTFLHNPYLVSEDKEAEKKKKKEEDEEGGERGKKKTKKKYLFYFVGI